MKYVRPKYSDDRRPSTALIVSSDEWARVCDAADEGRRDKERMDQLADEAAAKRDRCKKSVQKWPNTLASIQKIRQQQQLDAERLGNEMKLKEYEAIMEQREEQRQLMMSKAKQLLFERTEHFRNIKSGVILSAILEERSKQMDLAKEMRRAELEERLAETSLKRKLAREYEEELRQKRIDHVYQMEANRKIIDEQMKEVKQRREENEEEKRREKRDLDDMRKEMQAENERHILEIAENKKKLRAEQAEWTKITENYREQKLQIEKDFNQNIADYQALRDKLDKLRFAKEKELREEIILRRGRIPKDMLPQHADFTKEQEIMEKVLKAQEEKLDREHKARVEKKEKLRKELLRFEQEAIEKNAQQRKRDIEERRFEILQRLAIEENDRKREVQQEEEKRRKQGETREELVRQWEERERKTAETRWEDMGVYQQQHASEQNAILEYCQQIETTIAQSGKPLHPVQVAIAKVKKSAGLCEREKNVPFLKSRVPIQSVAVYQK